MCCSVSLSAMSPLENCEKALPALKLASKLAGGLEQMPLVSILLGHLSDQVVRGAVSSTVH